jgi:hypothetical protein
MGRRWELIAAQETVDQIRSDIGADSLGYLTRDGLIEAVGQPRDGFCMACFTGDYPMDVPQELDKLSLEPPDWVRDRHDIEWEASNGPGQEKRRVRIWEPHEAVAPSP